MSQHVHFLPGFEIRNGRNTEKKNQTNIKEKQGETDGNKILHDESRYVYMTKLKYFRMCDFFFNKVK